MNRMSIEAMKQALEALDSCDWDYDPDGNAYKTFSENLVNDASKALRLAIEQAEKQEPQNEHGFSDRTKTSRDICGND